MARGLFVGLHMGRPLRHQEPGSFFFVTTRCLESRFLLRPDPELRSQSERWLARALERSPGITMYAAIAMSNHLHMLLRDNNGTLSEFMRYYLGNLARSVNLIRGRSGPVFHRRYDATRILDPRSAVHYLAYLIANPVSTGLVERHEEWPGLLLYARNQPQTADFVWFDGASFRKARKNAKTAGKRKPNRKDFERHASATIHPLPFAANDASPSLLGGRALLALDSSAHAMVNRIADTPLLDEASRAPVGFVSASEAAYQEVRKIERRFRTSRGTRVLGALRILAQSPLRAPALTKRSPRPLVLCHASLADLHGAFRRAWRAFTALYRTAAVVFRAGNLRAPFPPFSFRPGGIPVS